MAAEEEVGHLEEEEAAVGAGPSEEEEAVEDGPPEEVEAMEAVEEEEDQEAAS